MLGTVTAHHRPVPRDDRADAAGEYLTSSYYERWLWAIERLAAEQGLLDSDDRPPAPTTGRRRRRRSGTDGSHPVSGSACATPRPPAHPRPALSAPARGRDRAGRLRLAQPGESAATGTYGEPELVYTVAFAAADLFGAGADHIVTADLGESDLEAVTESDTRTAHRDPRAAPPRPRPRRPRQHRRRHRGRHESGDGPSTALGARIVARAWVDPSSAPGCSPTPSTRWPSTSRRAVPLAVLEDTPTVHHVIVCTLCSCYPERPPRQPAHAGTRVSSTAAGSSASRGRCSPSSAWSVEPETSSSACTTRPPSSATSSCRCDPTAPRAGTRSAGRASSPANSMIGTGRPLPA